MAVAETYDVLIKIAVTSKIQTRSPFFTLRNESILVPAAPFATRVQRPFVSLLLYTVVFDS